MFLLWQGKKLQGFQWTTHGLDILLHDMSIYFGGLYIGMPHELLDDTNVYPVFEQIGGEGVTEGVGADTFCDSGPIHGDLDGLLQSGFKHVMPAKHIRSGILAQFFSRKNIAIYIPFKRGDIYGPKPRADIHLRARYLNPLHEVF